MTGSIFLIGPDNSLTELQQTDYDSEALLQKLLAEHPRLLGLGTGEKQDLLLVRRELGVPDGDDGSARWSLDHLFLDRRGVPILIEVKRASDTRARREVVAQMLDYAANGVAYWPIDRIVEAYCETTVAAGADPDEHLRAFLDGGEPEAFWQQVEANLRSGRVALVFVADRIGKELRRIVEFLNEQMRSAEVLAVEVEQFMSANGVRTLVPKLLGNTERAQITKSVAASKMPVSEHEWISELQQLKGEKARAMAVQALDWFRANGFAAAISDSQDSISLSLRRPDGKPSWPFFIRRSTGKLEASLQYLKADPAFSSDSARADLLTQFKKIPGVVVAATKITGWPSVSLEELGRAEVWEAVQRIASNVKSAIRSGATN